MHYLCFYKPCRGRRPRRPASRRFVAYYLKQRTRRTTPYDIIFTNTARLHTYVTIRTLSLPRTGCRGRQPLQFTPDFITTQNRTSLFGTVIPHSSLLTLPTIVHFALKPRQTAIINIKFHKNAKIHPKPIDIPLWVWYSINTLKHTKQLGLI